VAEHHATIHRPCPNAVTARAWALFVVMLSFILTASGATTAQPQQDQQPTITLTGDRLSGVVLPVEPVGGKITLKARRADAWTVDDTKRLLLQRDVEINIGSYNFVADRAVVWLNRLPSERGLINQIAVYFDQLEDPAKASGTSVDGEKLLVTGSALGSVHLNVALLDEQRPVGRELVHRAEQRLAQHLRSIVTGDPRLAQRPQAHPVQDPQQWVPKPGRTVQPEDVRLPPAEIPLPDRPAGTPWLSAEGGTVRFSAEQVQVQTGERENITTITGSIVVEYIAEDNTGELFELVLTAQRGVIFSDPGALRDVVQRSAPAEQVRGIYLEGAVEAVANDGQYAVRAPRVYYDFQTSKAIMLDAILRTYNRRFRVPIHARAKEMRQVAENQWQAKNVRVSTSEFHTPHLAIGSRRMTVKQVPARNNPREGQTTLLTGVDNTVRIGGTPILYWPKFSGRVEDTPIRNIGFGTRDNDGLRITTEWDLFSLLGRPAPEGVDMTLKADAFTKRGAALGSEITYNRPIGTGTLDLYGVEDEGIDRTSAGREVEPANDTRGVALWEHQMSFDQYWSAQAQLSYISDETFINAWREDDFENRREYETSLYLKRQQGREAFTLLGEYELNNFISNSYLLASRQYQVDKTPELTLRHYGWKLFDDEVTYSAETRLSRMRLRFEEHSTRELGLRSGTFGLPIDQDVSDSLRERGLSSQFVSRVDSRHEFSMPLQYDALNIVPFVVGRITAYSDDFEQFSSDSDDLRLFGASGVRLHTQFHTIDNSVENKLLDLHRLRHIVEPNATIWYGYSDVDQSDLPVYDDNVESLADGAAVRLGLRNTWQTQRGGPGRWRSVDVLQINSDLVFNSNEINRESPTAQFFDDRPEHSQFGDHVFNSLIWQLSDSLSFVSQGTYDLDESTLSRASLGVEMRHSPLLTTFVEYRVLDASDTELLDVLWRYQMTSKYAVDLKPQWDFENDTFRSVRFRVIRSFPDFDFIVAIRHDDIRDDTSLGASMRLGKF